MTLAERVAALGGIRPVRDTAVPTPEAEVAEIEHALGPLPTSYRQFLTTYGASMFEQSVEFDPLHRLPPTISSRGRGSVGVFYGAREHGVHGLLSALARYRDRMPEHFLPIAGDGGGNQIAMQLGGDVPGAVYYWDHNNEWDEEDYLEDDEPVPPDLKWQNVTQIATSFEDFIARLVVRPES